MNLPNKLTMGRMAVIPLFLIAMYLPEIPYHYAVALILFAMGAFTDFLDGYIARKNGLVTDFGKLMDPLADKLLVLAALLCFLDLGWIAGPVVFVIEARELLVTSIRLVAAGKGVVIAADKWGKMKTVFQMIWMMYGLWLLQWMDLQDKQELTSAPAYYIVYMVLLCVVVVLTVLSGANYLWKNRALLADR